MEVQKSECNGSNFIQIASLVVEDIFNCRKKSRDSNLFHMQKAVEWICRAQDATPDGGVPIRYALKKMSTWHPEGWNPSYPETTGYIIPTLINYSRMSADERYIERALRMAEWLITVQKQDGSFKGGDISSSMDSIVFDVGQIIFGFVSAYKQSKQEKFLDAARKAGDWLAAIQNEDGTWRKFSFRSISHSYHSRVAWSLLELYQVDGEEKYFEAGKKNVYWAASTQEGNGWFSQAGFSEANHRDPLTHTIAYTIRGILESGLLLNEEKLIAVARKTADALIGIIHPDGIFGGNYDSEWKSPYKYSCLTGSAQLSIIFSKLSQITGEKKFRETAVMVNGFLKSIQKISGKNKCIEGAIPGSSPIWGKYEGYAYPNWATKFFIDALMLEEIMDPSSKYHGMFECVSEKG